MSCMYMVSDEEGIFTFRQLVKYEINFYHLNVNKYRLFMDVQQFIRSGFQLVIFGVFNHWNLL